ncbi:ABC transporter permease [Sunxiuqinia elliptica]|uniref:Putative ABC transport system permease protein n=1 Tax=Sunxiuqinia elliptica TaxID=655355 RepID=A0A1I2AJ85_9BACT|nr:ABC transporter permease [Sunxiuqinia elliptica]SFE43003.1 putative ABC transport system permease protein [Sunxiuqinia elliptica]
MNYYLRMAFRNLLRERKHTLFLLSSVCIGIITFVLVAAYAFYEHGFDRVFPDNKNIYRVTTDVYSGNELSLSVPECERGVAASVKESYPGVVAAGFITKASNPQYKIGEEIFSNPQIYHASPGFLDVFSIALLQGDKSQVLTRPYTAIISESTAKKYFGSSDPVGQQLFKYPGYEYTIDGVFQDIPSQAHFKAEVLLSFHDDMHLPPPAKAQWGEVGFYTYLRLNEKAEVRDIESGINRLVAANKEIAFEKTKVRHEYHLQALNEIHLHSDLKDELQHNSKAEYVFLIFLVGVLILVASGFNYIQFSFSRLIHSAKYTGVKKINGATSLGMVWASLAESLVIHLLALLIALAAVSALSPLLRNEFNMLLEPVFREPLFLSGLFGILLLSVLINGALPAWLINQFSALELMTLKYKPIGNGISYRQLVVVGQFVIIIAIVVGIVGMNKQLNYMLEKDKGLDIENTLVVKVPQNLRRTSGLVSNLNAFEHDLLSHHAILGISISNKIPGDLPAYNFNFKEVESQKEGKAAIMVVDSNYIENYKMKLLAGTNFIFSGNAEGKNACIVNRACLSVLGFENPTDAIGRVLNMKDESGMQDFDVQIIGVTENVDFSSTKEKHEPIVLIDWTKNMLWGNYSLKLATSNYASVIPFIQDKFQVTFPNYPFEFLVVEDHYNKQFQKENELIKIFRLFILVAIFISVINLFTISWLIASARVKEIGIRKVNGAKIFEILTMLNKDFIKWVAIAFVIACPIAWYAMNKWLENFAYKTTLSWWIFALAGLLALGIALLTVSFQSWKAATRNPVEALRYE